MMSFLRPKMRLLARVYGKGEATVPASGRRLLTISLFLRVKTRIWAPEIPAAETLIAKIKDFPWPDLQPNAAVDG
jgi:hypothetical protein